MQHIDRLEARSGKHSTKRKTGRGKRGKGAELIIDLIFFVTTCRMLDSTARGVRRARRVLRYNIYNGSSITVDYSRSEGEDGCGDTVIDRYSPRIYGSDDRPLLRCGERMPFGERGRGG